jgi:hypothetical protein
MKQKNRTQKIYAGVLLAVGIMLLPTVMADTYIPIPIGGIITKDVPGSLNISWDSNTVPDQHDRPTKITLICMNKIRDGKAEAYSYVMRCRYFNDGTSPSQEHQQYMTMTVGIWITYLNNGTHDYVEYTTSTYAWWGLGPEPGTLVITDYNTNFETVRWDQCKITITEYLDNLPPWYLIALFPYHQPPPFPPHLIPKPVIS